MYSFVFKYEYVDDGAALEPRIALPCKEIRALFAASVVAVLARTVRVFVAPARFAVTFWRDTTLRLGVATVFVLRVVTAFARGFCTALRETTLRVATLREFVA